MSEITAELLLALATIRANFSLVMCSFVWLDDSLAFAAFIKLEQNIIGEFPCDFRMLFRWMK